MTFLLPSSDSAMKRRKGVDVGFQAHQVHRRILEIRIAGHFSDNSRATVDDVYTGMPPYASKGLIVSVLRHICTVLSIQKSNRIIRIGRRRLPPSTMYNAKKVKMDKTFYSSAEKSNAME